MVRTLLHVFALVTSLHVMSFTSANEIIIPLSEEEPLNKSLFDLREELRIPMNKYPDVKFKIMEQYLTLVQTSPKRSSRQSTWIDIGADSGILRQNDEVDREELCGDVPECYIILKVILLPQTEFRFFTLHFNILDVNDNIPTFPSQVADISVSETSEIGDEFSLDEEQATDPDLGNNSKISYSISPPSDYFQVRHFLDENENPHLRLVVSKALDYEKQRVHRVTLHVSDSGAPPMSNHVELRINVLDENDNAPVFVQEVYEVSLRESVPPGQDIALVKAVDKDSGRRGNIHYFIQNAEYLSLVEINSITGAVKLREKLNHKIHDGLQVIVEATDGDEDHPNSGRTILILHVEDVNDNAPVITINYIVYNQENTCYVMENEPINTFLAHVTATDGDKGDNGRVDLSVTTLIPGTEEVGGLTELGHFLITDDNLLATQVELNREERGQFDVIISASDHGNPALTTTRRVRIVIMDKNEFSPVFEHSDFNLYLPETKRIGSQIAVAKATDRDAENSPSWRLSDTDEIELSHSGDITYGINLEVDDQTGDVIPVSIDPLSGKITLIRSLDYEVKKTWKFTITATDGGLPLSLQSTCKLSIRVKGMNDNKPTFVTPSFDASSVYASTRDKSDVFTTIQALDFDVDEETKLEYSFYVSAKDGRHFDDNKYGDVFQMDGTTGNFSLNQVHYPERDILGTYKATIFVSDSGNPPLQSSMTLYIHVIDTLLPVDNGFQQLEEGDIISRGGSPKSPLAILIGAGIGGLLVLLIILVFIVFCIRRKQKTRRKHKEINRDAASESLTATPPPNDDDLLRVRTRSVAPRSNPLRSKGRICDHIYNTSSTLHTTLSAALDGSCHLCDIQTSPKGMQKFMEKKQGESVKATLPTKCAPYSHQPFNLEVSSGQSVGNFSPIDCENGGLYSGEQCTEMCRLYGHSDACWMPVIERSAMLQHKSPHHPRSPGQSKTITSRKDSGCSIETTSSSLSYYKLTKSERNHNNDVFVASETPLFTSVGKERALSEVSVMRSASHHNAQSITLTNPKADYRSLKKSKSEYSYEAADKPKYTHSHTLPSLSTEC